MVLWTGFSEAYASITLTLFVPLTIAAFGIVVRGSSFVPRSRRRAGRRPVEHLDEPSSMLGGVLAVAVVAFLAAVYPVWDASRIGDDAMVEYFRRRAVGSAVVAGVVAFGGIFVLRSDARYICDGPTSRALPLVILSAICGTGSLILVVRANHRGARLLAIGAVVAVVAAWGVAQWDYILPQTMTVAQAAAPDGTLTAILVATVAAVVLIFPAVSVDGATSRFSAISACPGVGSCDRRSLIVVRCCSGRRAG